MTLRFAFAMIACVGMSLMLARADGMPEPDDANYNPVKSVPGVPAPGVKPPPPIKQTKPAPAPPPEPVNEPEPEPDQPPPPTPSPAPAPATPPAPTPAPVVSPAPSPPPPPSTTAQRKPIYEVVSVDVQVGERTPAFATVTVKGTARTGGWKNVELQPLQTFAPEVGMKSFTLVGVPPSGMATQALTPVAVTIRIDPLPDDVKTIRVLGETNEVSQKFR